MWCCWYWLGSRWDGRSCWLLSERLRCSVGTTPREYVAEALAWCVEGVDRWLSFRCGERYKCGTSLPSGRACGIPARRAAHQPNRASVMHPSKVTGLWTALNVPAAPFNISPSTNCPLYNPKGKLFSVHPHRKTTPSSPPHVAQNGMYHSSLTVCLLAWYLGPTISQLADRCERQTQACPLIGKSATRIPKISLTTSTA